MTYEDNSELCGPQIVPELFPFLFPSPTRHRYSPGAPSTSLTDSHPPPSQHDSIFCRQSSHHHAERIQNNRCDLPVKAQITAPMISDPAAQSSTARRT
jgi:hypothetical protein